jgi:hypothetical protein
MTTTTTKNAPKKPAVSVRGSTYEKLCAFARKQGRTPRELLEEQLQRFLVERGIIPSEH